MVVDMSKYIKLYFYYIKMNIKKMIQYKTDTVIGIISNLLIQVSSIIFIWTIFLNVKELSNWTLYEIVLFYAVFTICKGLNNIFFDNLWIVGKEFLRKGTFDVLLVRPANELFQIIGSKIQFEGVGTLSLGFASLVFAIKGISISIGIKEILLLLVSFVIGTILIAGINLIFTVSSFWVIKSNNIIWMVYSFSDFAQYPLEMFGLGISFVLTYILPYGFVGYYPVCVILGKLPTYYMIYEVMITMSISIVSIVLWKLGLKKYESVGN